MVTENKIAAFLKLQQIALDIEDSTKLLEQFLPIALKEMNLLGYQYIFISSIFIDTEGQVKETFLKKEVNGR